MAVIASCPQPTAPLLRSSRSCALLRGAQLQPGGNARRAQPAAARPRAELHGSQEGCTTSGRTGEASPSRKIAGRPSPATALAALAAAAAALFGPEPALAAALHTEPANALSLPTWAVHTSSVIEWVLAMGLMYQYADATGNPAWRGMAWAMLPSLGGAMCACTWHFFYNSPDLEVRGGVRRARAERACLPACLPALPDCPHFQLWGRLCVCIASPDGCPPPPRPQFLVALQALLTVIGNTTCWIAAYRIYKSGQEQGA